MLFFGSQSSRLLLKSCWNLSTDLQRKLIYSNQYDDKTGFTWVNYMVVISTVSVLNQIKLCIETKSKFLSKGITKMFAISKHLNFCLEHSLANMPIHNSTSYDQHDNTNELVMTSIFWIKICFSCFTSSSKDIQINIVFLFLLCWNDLHHNQKNIYYFKAPTGIINRKVHAT